MKKTSIIINDNFISNKQNSLQNIKNHRITKTIDLGDYILTNYKIGRGAFSTIY